MANIPTQNDDLPTDLIPLADAIANALAQIKTVGNTQKIETNIRFEWVKDKGNLRGVIYKERNAQRKSIKYIGKGRKPSERHPEYDFYAEIYRQEQAGERKKSRTV